MERLIEQELLQWKTKRGRLPLIIRGARQVGKSYIVEKFGKDHFDSIVVVDFEFQPRFCECFETLDPKMILNRLEVMTGETIIKGKTLLFLDEIQQCPQAIKALRYFKEKMPSLHVIAAGSLLEFVLNESDFSFPVGRVQFMYLRPLSFREFLVNLNKRHLLEFFDHFSLPQKMPNEIHAQALELLRLYLLIGGMPAVVDEYLKTESLTECRRLQQMLLQTYQNDFGKYASKTQHKYLQLLFLKVPSLVAQHFKYSSVAPDIRSREIKIALDQLCYAGLVYRILSTAATGIPLEAQVRENRFKLLFLDIGLLHTGYKVDIQQIWDHDILQVHSGRLAEQFVGQELLAYADFYENEQLYFWKREKKSSSAEIDYVANFHGRVIPIEVKSGGTGRLKSLQTFMEEKKVKIGLKISQSLPSLENNILSVPLYMIEQIPRLLRECFTR